MIGTQSALFVYYFETLVGSLNILNLQYFYIQVQII